MDRTSPWNPDSHPVKTLILILSIVALSAAQMFADDEIYDPKIGAAARAIGGGYASKTQYALDVLGGMAISRTAWDDPLSVAYLKMSEEDRFGVAMVVLATSELDGEKAFNFQQMVRPDQKVIAERIKKLKRENVDEFLDVYSLTFEHFSELCERFFDVKPPGKAERVGPIN